MSTLYWVLSLILNFGIGLYTLGAASNFWLGARTTKDAEFRLYKSQLQDCLFTLVIVLCGRWALYCKTGL